MSSGFYQAFEEKHRGPRELIRARLEVYLPFVEGMAGIHPGMRVLDLGCGRGEWLELMKERGIDAKGVDLDAGMLKTCKALDFKVVKRDALKYLQAQPEGSLGIISAFHLVEHIPFETLQRLVEEARRVLLPGGLLIMETPNPENLVVGSANFYMDPTHIRPIPAPLLTFLPEFYGFARWKVLGLQEPQRSENEQSVTLVNVLNDVSPDYAVVAQAPGEPAQLCALDQAFSREYGISLTGLTQRFDQGLQTSLTDMRDRVERIEEEHARALEEREEERRQAQERAALAERAAAESAGTVKALREQLSAMEERLAAEQEKAEQRLAIKEQAVRAQARADAAERELEALQNRVQELEKGNHDMQARLAEAHATAEQESAHVRELEHRLQEGRVAIRDAEERSQAARADAEALRRSLSWRITAPLRWGLDLIRLLTGRTARPVTPRRWLRGVVSRTLGKPRLVTLVHRCLRPFPRLHDATTRFVTGVVASPSVSLQGGGHRLKETSDGNHVQLTPAARRVYTDLQMELERKRKRR